MDKNYLQTNPRRQLFTSYAPRAPIQKIFFLILKQSRILRKKETLWETIRVNTQKKKIQTQTWILCVVCHHPKDWIGLFHFFVFFFTKDLRFHQRDTTQKKILKRIQSFATLISSWCVHVSSFNFLAAIIIITMEWRWWWFSPLFITSNDEQKKRRKVFFFQNHN